MSGLGYPANVTGAPAARNHLKEVAMKTLLSFFVLGLLSLSLLPAEAQRVAAVEAYPTKPVKVIVPRPPGNANDLIARVLVQKLSESMRGQFYVENLPAGGGIVGMATAASAPADGHTILAANQDLIVHPLVKGKVPYDPFTSFAPVSLVASAPEVIVVHPSVPAKTIGELVALLKANPGKYSYASPGHGTSPHVACERLGTASTWCTFRSRAADRRFSRPLPDTPRSCTSHCRSSPSISRTDHCGRWRSRAASVRRCSPTCRRGGSRRTQPRSRVLGGHAGAGRNTEQQDRCAPSTDHQDRIACGREGTVRIDWVRTGRQHARSVRRSSQE
jgi:hypothetical protein